MAFWVFFFGYYGDHYLSYQSSIVACCISAWYRETWSLIKAVGFQKYPKRCPMRATIMSNIVTSRQYARTEVYSRCGQHCIPTGRRSWMTGIIVALWYNCTECLLAAKHVALFPGLQYAKTKVWKVSPFVVMIGRHTESGAWRRLFLVQSCSSIGGWNVWKAASIQLVVWYTQSWSTQSLMVGHDHPCVYRLSTWHHCISQAFLLHFFILQLTIKWSWGRPENRDCYTSMFVCNCDPAANGKLLNAWHGLLICSFPLLSFSSPLFLFLLFLSLPLPSFSFCD